MEKIAYTSTDLAPKAVGTYSQATLFQNILFFSGQIGINPKTQALQEGFEAQLKQILSNIDGLLAHHNLSRSHILKTTIFLKDLSRFSEVNKAYEDYFKAPYPARSCIEASRLPKEAEIEIEVIAAQY